MDELWEEMSGCVVMFYWSQFLKDESLTLLNITDVLDLDMVRLSRHRSSASNSVSNGVTPTEGAQADLPENKNFNVVEKLSSTHPELWKMMNQGMWKFCWN